MEPDIVWCPPYPNKNPRFKHIIMSIKKLYGKVVDSTFEFMPSNTANSSPIVAPNNQYQLPTIPAANTILSGADTAEPHPPSQSLAGPRLIMHFSSLSDIIMMVDTDNPSLQSSTNTNEPNQWLCNRNSLLLWNACSLMNKFNQFQSVVYTKNFDIICVTETWLNNTVYIQ